MGRRKVWPPTIYDHKSGRSRIRVNGRDYWLGVTGSEEARQEYARLVSLLAAHQEPAPAMAEWPTLLEVVARWSSEVRPGISAKEAAHYRHALQLLLAEGRGTLTSEQFGVRELEAVRLAMLQAPRRNHFRSRQAGAPTEAGWSRNHVNRQVVRLRTVWRWAEAAGLAPAGSWSHLRTLRALAPHDRRVRQTVRTRSATRGDLEAVLAHIRAPAVRTMLEIQWLSGMRSGEVRLMRVGEIDRTQAIWLYRPGRHKNAWRGQERVIPLGPQVQALLAGWLKRRQPEGIVFLTRNRRAYTAEGYALTAQRAAKKAGLAWFRPYCLRHGARQRITREMGLDAARSMLGQKSIETTNLYGDAVDLQAATEVARRCG